VAKSKRILDRLLAAKRRLDRTICKRRFNVGSTARNVAVVAELLAAAAEDMVEAD
jgi:hypothetical protein